MGSGNYAHVQTQEEAWRRIIAFGLHPNSGLEDPTPQFRQWHKFGRYFDPVWMLVDCKRTGAMGVIKNPTPYEWQSVDPKIGRGRVTLLWEINDAPGMPP
jgi:hypothetical protein